MRVLRREPGVRERAQLPCLPLRGPLPAPLVFTVQRTGRALGSVWLLEPLLLCGCDSMRVCCTLATPCSSHPCEHHRQQRRDCGGNHRCASQLGRGGKGGGWHLAGYVAPYVAPCRITREAQWGSAGSWPVDGRRPCCTQAPMLPSHRAPSQPTLPHLRLCTQLAPATLALLAQWTRL